MATRKRGKCCAGELCKHKNLQLCKSHKCSGCNGIVHLLCAAEDAKTDKRVCFKCSSKAAAKRPPPKSTKKKACKACGGTDHERKSSFLCKHNSSKKAPSSASVPSTKRGKQGEKKSDGKKNEAEDKNISRPNFVHMKHEMNPHTTLLWMCLLHISHQLQQNSNFCKRIPAPTEMSMYLPPQKPFWNTGGLCPSCWTFKQAPISTERKGWRSTLICTVGRKRKFQLRSPYHASTTLLPCCITWEW